MRLAVPLLLFAAAACDSPHPLSEFAGAPVTRVQVVGSDYAVRVSGNRAQAVRRDVDFDAVFNRGDFVARAGLAIEQASGCRVVSGSLKGDAAMAEARLTC